LALGDNALSRFLIACNNALIGVSRGLFSYQIMVRAHAQPILATLLKDAEDHSATRAGLLELNRALGESAAPVHEPAKI
jgi:hypothetical protein